MHGEKVALFSKSTGGEQPGRIFLNSLVYRPLFIKRALRWAGGPFLQKIFLQIFNRKGHTHILTKIGEKNPVINGIGPFDN